MSIFNRIWETPVVRIATGAEEVAVIERAKAGEEAATLALFGAYVALLRAAVGRYTKTLSRDDARQAAVEGLLTAVGAFDPAKSDRLASLLRQHVDSALASAAGQSTAGFTVPERTLKRFFGILARADGNVTQAAVMAPEFDMATETFYGVLAAVNASGSLEAEVETRGFDAPVEPVYAERQFADAEDKLLVSKAFSAVDDLERDVCRLAYGFADYDPQPDAEVGFRLGMGRVKTLRIRQGALKKMASALGA